MIAVADTVVGGLVGAGLSGGQVSCTILLGLRACVRRACVRVRACVRACVRLIIALDCTCHSF